jgi:hypothetical protein
MPQLAPSTCVRIAWHWTQDQTQDGEEQFKEKTHWPGYGDFIPQKTPPNRQSPTELATSPSTASNTNASNVKSTNTNGSPQSQPKLNEIIASLRLNRATTPAVSSPLQQVWGQDDIPSPNSSPTSTPKSSQAAVFMTKLICEATPTKKPGIANSYQIASLVKTAKPLVKKPLISSGWYLSIPPQK